MGGATTCRTSSTPTCTGPGPRRSSSTFRVCPSRGGARRLAGGTGQDDDRDLALVDAALTSLREEFKVDEARIYSTGFSNGANFTYLLWAERPAVFAAFAPVAARLRPSVQLAQPRPIFHIAGTEDAQILYADQLSAIEAARRANGVTGKGAAAAAAARCTTPRVVLR